MTFNEFINEDLGNKSSTEGYGVKGKFKVSHMSDKEIVNPNVEFTKEDATVVNEILNKIERGIQLFAELEDNLIEYNKINHKPVTTVIAELQSFKEAIEGEMENMA